MVLPGLVQVKVTFALFVQPDVQVNSALEAVVAGGLSDGVPLVFKTKDGVIPVAAADADQLLIGESPTGKSS